MGSLSQVGNSLFEDRVFVGHARKSTGGSLRFIRHSSAIHPPFIAWRYSRECPAAAPRCLHNNPALLRPPGSSWESPGNPLGHPRPSRGLAWRPVLVRGTRSWVHPPLSGLAKLGGQRSNPSHQPSASLAFLRSLGLPRIQGASGWSSFGIHRVDLSSLVGPAPTLLGISPPWPFPGAGPLERL